MSDGLIDFISADLAANNDQLGEDGKDGKTYLVKLSKQYTGDYDGQTVRLKKGHRLAVKTFKSKKSINKIKKEVEYQQICAVVGISPTIVGVNYEEKYIVMNALDDLPANEYANQELPDDIQYMICALMGRLDQVKVLHGDMNALNVMVSGHRPYMIDFGFAKKITATVYKKHGAHPNFTVSLWGLVRGFSLYKVGCAIMEACMETCKARNDISDYINQGEILLNDSKKRKR